MLVLLAGLSAGCTARSPLAPGCRNYEESTSNADPPGHCLFFPRDVALDPLGDVLYVASGNDDSSFGGATLASIDLLRHERAMECFRRFGTADGGDALCGQVSCADAGSSLAADTTIEEMERVEARTGRPAQDFDRCYCQRDAEDVNVINCESQRFIQRDQTVKLGGLPASMEVLSEDPPNWQALPEDTTLHRGIYIGVRLDPSVTFIDVQRPLKRGRRAAQDIGLSVSCGNPLPTPGKFIPGERYPVRTCSDANRVQRTSDEVLIDPQNPEAGTRARLTVPNDPSALVIDRGCIEPGYKHLRGTFSQDPAQNPRQLPPCFLDQGGAITAGHYYQYLVAGHLARGEVSAYDLGSSPVAPVAPVLQDVSQPIVTQNSQGLGGLIPVAPRVPGDLSEPWYVASRLGGIIPTFRLASAGGAHVVPGFSFRIDDQFPSSYSQDIRDFHFQPGGERAFATVYRPPALVILDTSTRGGRGVPLNQVTGIVNMCLGPARSVVAQVPRRFMGTVANQTRVYTTCSLSGQLAEVDPDTASLTYVAQLGRGPHSLALGFGQGTGGTAIDPCADPFVSDGEAAQRGVTCPQPATRDLRLRLRDDLEPIGPRAYISMLFDNAVAVVDLDPRSPTYRRLIGRIGLPLPKQVQ